MLILIQRQHLLRRKFFSRKKYFPISWPAYNTTIPIVGVSLVITSSGIRPKVMLNTLDSFFAFNTY